MPGGTRVNRYQPGARLRYANVVKRTTQKRPHWSTDIGTPARHVDIPNVFEQIPAGGPHCRDTAQLLKAQSHLQLGQTCMQ
jgi:hypothetical protein